MAHDKEELSKLTEKLMLEASHFIRTYYPTDSDEAKATIMLAYVQAFAVFANR